MSAMYQLERMTQLHEYVNQHGRASVKELSIRFDVSAVTIRRDIEMLASQSMIIKVHGGVLSTTSKLTYEAPFFSKSKINTSEKEAIGKLAAGLIDDNDVIYIDAGTTTLEVAKHIGSKNITVVTHDINIAMEITKHPNIDLIVVGGQCMEGVYTLIGGQQMVDYISRLHVNKSFMGCDGIDIAFGISNATMSEIDVKRAIQSIAMEVILVTDKSKWGQTKFFSVFGIDKIDKIVTDHLSGEYLSACKENNIEVLITD